MKGKVTLVGAGPGDLGLLTIKGKKAVENADVIIYDRLVGKDILALMPEEAEKINAGKNCGRHLIPQNEINDIIVKKANEGKNVVRLKGGDSFVFGRGSEELLKVIENNINFEVIPGISSALSVPAYAGIPVTDRNFSSSVHIITGHSKENTELIIDFESLVKLKGTLIFLMGLKNLDFIVKGLINAGMKKDTSCAVIQDGTKNTQKSVFSSLDKIFEEVNNAKIKSPAVIVVGEVCSFSDKLNWFEKLPLKGKKIIVTRPEKRISYLSQKLNDLGADVTELPCIETIDKKISFDKIKEKIELSKWIVFTSPSGVSVFFDKVRENNLDSRIFSNKKIAVIGSGTASELLKYNLIYDLMPEKYYSEDLANILVENVLKEDKICILRAENGSKDLCEILKNNNIQFFDLGIYETVFKSDCKIDKINEFDFVTFTSKSTVNAFCKIIENRDYKNIKAVCIGKKTFKAAYEKGFDCCISDEVSIDSIIDKLLEMEISST